MPCWEFFDARARTTTPGSSAARRGSGSRPACGCGWNRWLGRNAAFVGMTGFGASAPAEALYPHFHITPERVAEMARSLLSSHRAGTPAPTERD